MPTNRNPSTDAATSASEDRSREWHPREIYNRGLKQLRTDFDEAEALLTMARRDAATDGEVRYRATYNMGWVEANRADSLIDQQPQQALEHLQWAAGWFRDAVRLRKDSADARHNLEVVLLRILQLRDQLSQQDDKDLAAQLDALIASQRSMVGQLRMLVEQVTASAGPNISDEFRTQFQRLAVDQRVALSDLQDVVDQAASELDTLNSKPEAERTPEDNVRLVQLSARGIESKQSTDRTITQPASSPAGVPRFPPRCFRTEPTEASPRSTPQSAGNTGWMLSDLVSAAQQTALKSRDKQVVADAKMRSRAWLARSRLPGRQPE